MKLTSKKKYLLLRIFQETVNWPIIRLRKSLCSDYVVDSYKGIQISDVHPRSSKDPAAVVRIAKDALALIERKDPRRFRLIQREVTFIVNDIPLNSADGAEYDTFVRRITMNLTRRHAHIESNREHYDWYIATVAATFVHEATHGRIFSLHIEYTKELRLRIESLCNLEAKRFASKLDKTRYDFHNFLVDDFDPHRWQESWNLSHLRRAINYLKRYRGR